jgi:hypothetical protein
LLTSHSDQEWWLWMVRYRRLAMMLFTSPAFRGVSLVGA